jgi:hypothetical protein
MSARKLFAAAALLAATTPAAYALDLFTPNSQATDGSVIRCSITNPGTRPVEVTATILDQSGNDITNSGNCYGNPATLDPGKVCSRNSAIPDFKSGYCHFTTTSSKVRAALLIVDSNSGVVTSAFGATK